MPEIFAGLPTLRVEMPFLVGLDYRIKRSLDFIGASVGLILLSPFLLAIAIAIKTSSPGPIFFQQERVGLQGKVFQMWKFRTMVINADELQSQLETQNESEDGIMFKLKHDPRIIPIGHFLRKTSLDELPNLINIIKGDMVFVGPRPALYTQDDLMTLRVATGVDKLKPGITGWAQINGRDDISIERKVQLEQEYLKAKSFLLDIEIIIKTFTNVLFSKGVSH
jgi:lipopolysaccharide/colanic/teichoic acid biosynthesis glycosyltransferase